jgi:hypothetical protein
VPSCGSKFIGQDQIAGEIVIMSVSSVEDCGLNSSRWISAQDSPLGSVIISMLFS